MKEKIVQYFNQLFLDAPETGKALELRKEMTQNALDKFEDLLQDGYSEEEAYQNVIGSIGDVTELFGELEEKNLLTLSEKDRKKKAILQAVASGIYILAGAVFFAVAMLGEMYGEEDMSGTVGLILAALICIPPTIMMVYAANMYPAYKEKEKKNMVEEYKEEQYQNNRQKAIISSISTLLWTLVLALYFLISFTTGAWYLTWIIFLIGGSLQSIVSLIFSLRQEKR